MGVKWKTPNARPSIFYLLMNKNLVAGLDIGTAAIRLVVCEQLSESRTLRILAQAKKESRGLKRGYIINFEETLENLRETVREAERQAKLPIKNVFLGVGGITLEAKLGLGQVAVAEADGEITESDIRRAVEAGESGLGDLTNRHIISNQPVAFRLDGKRILGRPEGLRGGKLEAKTIFVHCLKQHLQDLIRVTEMAGLAVDDIVAAPLAASTSALSVTQKAAGCVLINIGSQTTSMVVWEDGVPLTLQVFPLGSMDVTTDTARGLRLPLDEAERMKLDENYAVAAKRKLDEIIEARLSDMFELIETALRKIGRSGLLPAGAVIVGAGARVNAIEKLASHTLRLPAKLFDPLTDPQMKSQIKDAGWVVAYGLCLQGLAGERSEGMGQQVKRASVRVRRWFRELLP